MSSLVASGLDRQQITSHFLNSKLDDFEDGKKKKRNWDDVKNACVWYLRKWGFEDKALKFESCSEDYAVFQCLECDKDFCAPITCGLRICPSCRKRLRGRFVDGLKDHIKDVKNHRHMVLTIPNLPSDVSIDEISDTVKAIKKAFGQLRRRKYFDKRVKGCIYGIEVKEGDNGYNIHLHAFLALEDWVKYPNQFDYKKIANMWLDYFPNADASAQEFRKHRSIKTALIEVVSYATKGCYFESGLAMAKWTVAMDGTRLIGRTGCFFGIKFSREKDYVECPYCHSTDVAYIGKWSELVAHDIRSEPPPTIQEIKAEQNGDDCLVHGPEKRAGGET